MFNPTKDIYGPGDKEVSKTGEKQDESHRVEKPKEKPTPSQVGSFLGALDKPKDKEKSIKEGHVVEDPETSGDETEDLFGLIGSATKKPKGKFEEDDSSDTTQDDSDQAS